MKPSNSGKSDGDDEQPRLAMLIDADNAQPAVIERLPAKGEVRDRQRQAHPRRFHQHPHDPVEAGAAEAFDQPGAAVRLHHGQERDRQFADHRRDDLLYTRHFDGMCLVSGDSDFTRLAQRMREEGLNVYGFGERKTPAAFVQACDFDPRLYRHRKLCDLLKYHPRHFAMQERGGAGSGSKTIFVRALELTGG